MRRLKKKTDDETMKPANDDGPPLPPDDVDDAALKKVGIATSAEFEAKLSDAVDRKIATASIADLEEISDPVDPPGPKLAKFGPGMRRMIERVFPGEEEIPTVYGRVKEWLQAVDPGHAMKALNDGEALWHELSRAVAGAKLEKKKWEIDNSVSFGVLWDEANKELQAEKEAGHRNKTITDKDVEARCAASFPDAWRFQELEKEKVHRTVAVLEQMLEQVGSRVRTLTAIVNKGR